MRPVICTCKHFSHWPSRSRKYSTIFTTIWLLELSGELRGSFVQEVFHDCPQLVTWDKVSCFLATSSLQKNEERSSLPHPLKLVARRRRFSTSCFVPAEKSLFFSFRNWLVWYLTHFRLAGIRWNTVSHISSLHQQKVPQATQENRDRYQNLRRTLYTTGKKYGDTPKKHVYAFFSPRRPSTRRYSYQQVNYCLPFVSGATFIDMYPIL